MSKDIVERLRDQRDEDGYCVVCGDGKWKSHFPKCTLCDAADELERLRSLITAYVEADDGYHRLVNPSEKVRLRYAECFAALRAEVGR